MSDKDELAGKTEDEMKAIAAAYNKQHTGEDDSEEAKARAAAEELAKNQGNLDPDGKATTREDTDEDKAKKAEEEAAAKKKAEEEAAAAAEAAKTPEQKAEEEAAAKKEAAKLAAEAEWIELDGVEGKAAMNILKKSGITPSQAQEIFGEALNSIDISKVDKAALVEAIGEDNATLAMAGFTAWAGKEGAVILDKVANINEAVGGNENWLKMQKWARAKAETDADFKAEIEDLTGLLNGSKTAGRLAAQQFMQMYNADKANTAVTPTPAKTIKPTDSAGKSEVLEPMSKREYAEALMDMQHSNLRGAARAAAEAKLSARRRAGREQGLD